MWPSSGRCLSDAARFRTKALRAGTGLVSHGLCRGLKRVRFLVAALQEDKAVELGLRQ